MPSEIPVAIFGGARLWREALASALAREPDIRIISDVANISTGHTPEVRPVRCVFLILADSPGSPGMPVMPPRKDMPDAGQCLVVARAMPEEEALFWLRNQAGGILSLDTGIADLAAAIRVVATGGKWLDTPFLQLLMNGVTSAGGGNQATASWRDRQVLELVAGGCSNKEIAARLHISEATVKSVLRKLFRLHGVRTRVQLVREHRKA